MGTDFTGGGFEELARETEKLKADAARLRAVTQTATRQTATDETARRRLAERARAATSRSLAEAETLVARGATAARAGAEVTAGKIGAQRAAMDALARSSRDVLVPLRQLRQWGPYAFSRSAQGAQQLYASMARIRGLGTLMAPTGQAAGATPIGRLNQRVGYSQTAPPPTAVAGYNASRVNQYSAAVSRTATSHAVLNAQMMRHGALSSEFIQALARGQVGLREFGSQLTVTAGKFGGWLAAGAGIFALLGTLGAVGKGAIDASSGVNQLQRVVNNVDPSSLQSGFRGLSEHYNLPIATVSDAVYQMGKRFHDQNEALEASKSVLNAVKVGELDVATASRYLTAVTNGFNLSAEQQTGVFDQVNQAQNLYGSTIQNLLAGTSKAAGAFRNAGGDATQLIALITTLSKVSGQTGDVIGTAIQRSPHFIAMDQNQAVLQKYGIDAKQPIFDIYTEAIETAKKLAPDKQRELSEALFGPQYGARVGTFLLQQGPLLQQVMKDVSPESSKGSADRELDRALGAFTERIAAVGIQLGALGSNLASSGFLDILALGLQLLTTMLATVNNLMEVWNTLPEPIRHVVFLLGEMYVLYRLLRRFNVGSTLPGAAGRALTNPRNAINAERESQVVRRNQLSDSLVSASGQVTNAQIDQVVAREKLRALQQVEADHIRGGTAATEQGVRASQQAVAARTNLAKMDSQIANARLRESVISRELSNTAQQEAALRRVPSNFQPRSGTGTPRDVLNYIDSAQALSPTRQRIAQAQARLVQNMRQYGLIGGTLATGGQAIGAAANRVYTSARSINLSGVASRVRSGASRLATRARGVATMMSPVDLAVAAIGIFFAGLSEINSRANEISNIVSDAATATSAAEVDQANQKIQDAMSSPPTFYIPGAYEGLLEQQEDALDYTEEQQAGINNFKIAIERMGRGERLAPEERAAYKAGTYQDVYEGMAADIRKRIFQHSISMAQGEKMLDLMVKRIRNDPHIEDPEGLISQLRDTATQDKVQADIDTMRKQAELTAAQGPLYSPVGDARRAAQSARDILSKLQRSKGEKDEILDARVEVANAERALDEATNDQAKALVEARGTLAISQINPENAVGRARQAVENARKEVQLARQQKRPREEIMQLIAAVNDAENERDAAIRERAVDIIDTAARMREANAPLYAPLISEQTALWAARRKLEALRRHNAGRSEIRDAIATVAETERALALAANDRARALLELQGEISIAGIDPENSVAVARQALTNASSVYNLVVAQGRDQEEVMRAYLSVLQAQQALQQAIEDRAEAIAAARFDILGARAERSGNEVRQAAIAARQAIYQLHHADTREETLQARAALIRARTQRRDAIYQTEIEDIEFQADIGRLTVQQQIRAYERLLRTLELNRDMRRDLRRKIYALKHEADEAGDEFTLRVGDIRLPTIYEIRRAMGGGINQNAQVIVNQKNEFTANGPGADQAVRQMKDAMGQSADRARNALRSAGM